MIRLHRFLRHTLPLNRIITRRFLPGASVFLFLDPPQLRLRQRHRFTDLLRLRPKELLGLSPLDLIGIAQVDKLPRLEHVLRVDQLLLVPFQVPIEFFVFLLELLLGGLQLTGRLVLPHLDHLDPILQIQNHFLVFCSQIAFILLKLQDLLVLVLDQLLLLVSDSDSALVLLGDDFLPLRDLVVNGPEAGLNEVLLAGQLLQLLVNELRHHENLLGAHGPLRLVAHMLDQRRIGIGRLREREHRALRHRRVRLFAHYLVGRHGQVR